MALINNQFELHMYSYASLCLCITNLIDHKVYIGKHSTENLEDGYMGSGKLVSRAIAKHGLENFRKDFLGFFDTDEQVLGYERELVTEEFVSRKDTYNLIPGGKGGWASANLDTEMRHSQRISNGKTLNKWRCNKLEIDVEYRKRCSARSSCTMSKLLIEGKIRRPDWNGRKHKPETIKKMSEKAKLHTGNKNSSYGTMWICNEITKESKKIQRDDFQSWIDNGWKEGRFIPK